MRGNRFVSFKSRATHMHITYKQGRWSGRSRQQTRLDLVLTPLPVLYGVAERPEGGGTGERASSPGVVGSVTPYTLFTQSVGTVSA